MRELPRLLAVVLAAGLAAAGTALYFEQRPETAPSAGDEAAAARVRSYYSDHPPRPDWRVRRIIATAGRVLVRLEVPSVQAAALLKSPMGFQQSTIARACPGDVLWHSLDGATQVQIRARMPTGETFLRVDCRQFRSAG